MADKSRRMLDKASALTEQIDQSFASKEKRDEVKGELDSSRSSLSGIGTSTDKAVASSMQLLKGVAETLAGATAAPKADKAKADKSKVEKDKNPSAAKPAKDAKPAAAKPAGKTEAAGKPDAPATPPSTDFNP
jgi:hypothetical protein